MTTTTSDEIDPVAFREALGYYPTGVAVVTAIDPDGAPVGMVVGSFTSVSLDPPLVAYLPQKSSSTYARLRQSPTFCVNVLAADQQELCRRFASRGADKFEGVAWRPSPSGAPVLDGAVTWVDCEVREELDGGDHHIVLGKVRDLGVNRPALPLLFFQGGYGRFSLPSLVAPGDPDLIQGVRLAESARDALEKLAADFGADCSVLARVGDEGVFVLTAHEAENPSAVTLGHRVPLIPPLGSVFFAHASDEDVERWLDRAKGDDDARALYEHNLATVRERGYSLSLMPEEELDRVAVMSAYSSPEVMPMHEREMRQMIASTARLYEPPLEPGRRYRLHSIVVPVPGPDGQTRIAMRMSRLPQDVSVDAVEAWIGALKAAAAKAVEAVAGCRGRGTPPSGPG